LPDPLPANPLALAAQWLAQARSDAAQPNPDSMILATVDGSGHPSARVLLCKDIDAAAETLRTADAMVLQFEIPLETIYYAVEFANKNKIRCIVNPAPAQPANLEALRTADYFIPNESEAETITGLPVHSVEEAKLCATALLQKGFARVILTLGSRGSLLATAESAEVFAPFAVTPLDTTGAGDAFIGSFAVFLGEGLPEREALTRANLYAGLSTMQVGTQKSFPTRARFETEWQNRRAAAR